MSTPTPDYMLHAWYYGMASGHVGVQPDAVGSAIRDRIYMATTWCL